MADLFEINSDGWISQQRGREAYELVREIIQNALDTETDIDVTIDYDHNTVTVRDYNEQGVSDLGELWTVFGGDKKGDPTKRGRYGRGMKETVGGTDAVTVVTTEGSVEFDVTERERFTSEDETTDVGTKVSAYRKDWSPQDLEGVERFVERLWVPEDITITLTVENAGSSYTKELVADEPDRVYESKLTTVVVDSDGVMQKDKRRTEVRVKRDENGGIYEMGIPVTSEEDFNFLIDVQQKIPMAEQREEPKGNYRDELVASLLNHCLDLLERNEIKSDWVSSYIHNYRVSRSVQKEFIEKRYPTRFSKGLAMPSGGPVDDIVGQNGYHVLTTSSMPISYQSMMKKLVPSTEEIMEELEDDLMEQTEEATEEQQEFIRFVNRELVNKLEVEVDIECAEMEGRPDKRARYVPDERKIYLNTLNREWGEVSPANVGVVLHELAHANGEHDHDIDFIHELQNLAGRYIVKESQTF